MELPFQRVHIPHPVAPFEGILNLQQTDVPLTGQIPDRKTMKDLRWT